MGNFVEKLDIVFFEDLEKKLPHMIPMAMKGHKLDEQGAEQYVRKLAEFDPTPQKKYIQWIIKQSFPNKKLRQTRPNAVLTPPTYEDGERISRVIQTIEQIKNKGDFKRALQSKSQQETEAGRKFPPTLDLNILTFRQLESFISELGGEESVKSKAQKTEQIKLEGAQKVYPPDQEQEDDGIWKVIKIIKPAAAVHYGRGSRWCTTELRSDYVQLPNKTSLSCKIVSEDPIKGINIEYHTTGRKKINRNIKSDSHRNYNPPKGLDYVVAGMRNEKKYVDGNLQSIPVTDDLGNPLRYEGYPETADSYIRNHEGLYIFFREGKPYAQASGDFSELKNLEDDEAQVISPLFDFMLAWFSQDVPLSSKALNSLNRIRQQRCRDYTWQDENGQEQQRPPLHEPEKEQPMEGSMRSKLDLILFCD